MTHPTPPSFFVQTMLVAKKDLAIERRTGEIVVTGGFFGALLAILTSVAFYEGPAGSHHLAPGAIWLATAFSAVLALGRTWQRERDDGALDALLAGPVSRAAVFFGKALGVGAFLVAIELVVVPLVSLMLHVDLGKISGPLVILLGLATIGVAASGTLFGAMTVRTRARELVLATVLFPMLAPTLLAAAAGTRDLLHGHPLSELGDYFMLIGVFGVVFTAGGLGLFESLIDG